MCCVCMETCGTCSNSIRAFVTVDSQHLPLTFQYRHMLPPLPVVPHLVGLRVAQLHFVVAVPSQQLVHGAFCKGLHQGGKEGGWSRFSVKGSCKRTPARLANGKLGLCSVWLSAELFYPMLNIIRPTLNQCEGFFLSFGPAREMNSCTVEQCTTLFPWCVQVVYPC